MEKEEIDDLLKNITDDEALYVIYKIVSETCQGLKPRVNSLNELLTSKNYKEFGQINPILEETPINKCKRNLLEESLLNLPKREIIVNVLKTYYKLLRLRLFKPEDCKETIAFKVKRLRKQYAALD